MTGEGRYGTQYGPDITFLGVDRCDLSDPSSYAGADVVIVGAPFDGGTSHRPGTRFGPMAIRGTDYLPADGSRPHLALRVDGLRDLRVLDAGDVEMYSGDTERSIASLEEAVHAVSSSGAVPLVLGGDHTIALPDATGVARHHGFGRVSMLHFDAHADTGHIEFGSLYGHGQPMRRLIESGALRGDRFLQIGLRGYWPPPDTLDWMAEQRMRSFEMTEIGKRGLDTCLDEAFEIALDECDGVFLSVDVDVCDPGHAPGTGTRTPADCRHGSCSTRYAASAWSSLSSAWTSWRSRRRTTTPRSPPSSPTGSPSRRCPPWRPASTASVTTRPDRCSKAADTMLGSGRIRWTAQAFVYSCGVPR